MISHVILRHITGYKLISVIISGSNVSVSFFQVHTVNVLIWPFSHWMSDFIWN